MIIGQLMIDIYTVVLLGGLYLYNTGTPILDSVIHLYQVPVVMVWASQDRAY